MDKDRVEKLIQFALLVASQKDELFDRELSRIHLIKYVYLADLAYANKHNGETWSQARWQFHNFGPWAAEVNDCVQSAAEAIGAQEHVFSSKYGDDTVRWSVANDNDTADVLDQMERELPLEVAMSIRSNVRKFGNETEGLLHHTYLTEPMLRAAPRSELLFVAEPKAEYAASAPTVEPSAKQKKRSQAALTEARARFAQRFAAHQKAKAAEEYAPPPRYDEEFFEGVQWLDSLAGDPPPSGNVRVAFDDSVWDSDTRRARR
jgi:hypothetical protein